MQPHCYPGRPRKIKNTPGFSEQLPPVQKKKLAIYKSTTDFRPGMIVSRIYGRKSVDIFATSTINFQSIWKRCLPIASRLQIRLLNPIVLIKLLGHFQKF